MQSNRPRHCFRRGLLAALLGIAGAAPVMASPLLPALVEPATQEHHVGKVIFVELVTPDLAAAKQFYAGLFGWTFRDIQAGRTAYAEASLDGRPVAGLIHKEVPAGEHRQPAWLGFIAVRDVDAAKEIALKHGAKVTIVQTVVVATHLRMPTNPRLLPTRCRLFRRVRVLATRDRIKETLRRSSR